MVACMAVMARETWTDERLDDLRADMNKGFDESKKEVRDLRAETKAEFAAVRSEIKEEFRESRKEMNSRFDAMNVRFDSLQKTLVVSVVSVSASVITALIVSLF
jgi:predicted HicB family RNase H-like nuclease